MNIVLDMDHTLVHGSHFEKVVHPRPHLFEFLLWCFKSFEKVSIWTAASLRWYEFVDCRILTPFLDRIKEELCKNVEFDFVWTADRCTSVWLWDDVMELSRKTTIKSANKLFKNNC